MPGSRRTRTPRCMSTCRRTWETWAESRSSSDSRAGDASISGRTAETDGASGEISSLYLEYLHPEGNAQAKLGRFFLTEGAAMDTLDGAFVKMTTPLGVGFSLYAGIPVEYSILDNVERGDSLYGGRLFYARAGIVEVGFSYLKEDGSTGDKDRELIGGDLWLRIAKGVEINGQAAYDREVSEMASQRYAIRFVPGSAFDITAGYETYSYEALFRPALNPVFTHPTADNTDDVQKIFIIMDWGFAPGWTLEVGGKTSATTARTRGTPTGGRSGCGTDTTAARTWRERPPPSPPRTGTRTNTTSSAPSPRTPRTSSG